jgi:Beta-ketoacyl synthase, N-terminal domain
LNYCVVVSAFGVWSPGGVRINTSPLAGPAGAALAPWPDAPALSFVHPRARTPPRQAALLVQLAHALLAARAAAGDGAPSPQAPADTDLLLGTARGSEAVDRDFLHGLQQRGSGFGSPSSFVYTLATAAPAEVALALGLRSSLATLSAGDVSGLSAVAMAAKRVSQGRSRACLTGGVELAGPRFQAVSGDAESEIAALFLLEASAEQTRWPVLGDAELGFDPDIEAGAAPRWDAASTSLLALASACAEPTRRAPIAIAGRSHEGHWARFSVR